MGAWDKVRGVFGRRRGDQSVSHHIVELFDKGYSQLEINRQIYNIPEVRTAINFVAEKCAGVPMHHAIADARGNIRLVNDAVERVLSVRPNPWQTPFVFWTQVETQKLLTNNCFIYPDWGTDADEGALQGLYVLPWAQFEFTHSRDGRAVVMFPASPKQTAFYYDNVIHLQRFPTFKGGRLQQATQNYIDLVDALQGQAVKDSAASGRVRAVIRTEASLNAEHLKKKLEEFRENFMTADNITGFGMVNANYSIQELKERHVPLNAALLDAITRQLYNYFGVSFEIINGTATAIQHQQFTANTVRAAIKQRTEELSYKLFSGPEIARNHRIIADMTTVEVVEDKTQFYKEMIFGGVMTRNEIRIRLGLPRGPDALDEFMESKNFGAIGTPSKEGKGDEADADA